MKCKNWHTLPNFGGLMPCADADVAVFLLEQLTRKNTLMGKESVANK